MSYFLGGRAEFQGEEPGPQKGFLARTPSFYKIKLALEEKRTQPVLASV